MIFDKFFKSPRNLADIDRDGKMTMQEFTVAMHLIQNKLKGFEVPASLPNSLKMTSMPSSFAAPQKTNTMSGVGGSLGHSGGSSISNGFSSGAVTLPKQSGISWSGMGQTGAAPSAGAGGFGTSFTSGTGGAMSSLPSSFNTGAGTGFSSSANVGILNGSNSRENVQRANSLSGNYPPTAGNYGTISSSSQLKYNQMFKAHDQQKTGFLTGRWIVIGQYLDLNSPNLCYTNCMNSVGRIDNLTNFNPNRRSPANFSILYHTLLAIN